MNIKDRLDEYNDASQALCDWFASQEIEPGKAVAVMGYLIGVMAAEASKSSGEVITKIELASMAAKAIGLEAFMCKQ